MNGKCINSIARSWEEIEHLITHKDKGKEKKMSRNFIQLSQEDCSYLLDLIQTMDAQTQYTVKQRALTIQKLDRVEAAPEKTRLAFQDVEYLLDLIEDDELPETEQQRTETQLKLEEIMEMQKGAFESARSIEEQRAARRALRNPNGALQGHFQRTSAEEL